MALHGAALKVTRLSVLELVLILGLVACQDYRLVAVNGGDGGPPFVYIQEPPHEGVLFGDATGGEWVTDAGEDAGVDGGSFEPCRCIINHMCVRGDASYELCGD